MQRTLVIPAALCAAAAGAIAVAVVAYAATEQQQCLAAQLKAIGKNEACRFKAQSTSTLKGTAPDVAKCATKFAEAWQKAEAKYGADCPDVTDTAMDGQIVQHVNSVLATLTGGGAGTCGDGALDAGEECDGITFPGGVDCVAFGYSGGTLLCDPGCVIDTSSCTNNQCSLLAQDCMAGDGCYPTETGNQCAPAGTTADGGVCTASNDCVAGSACADLGGGNLVCVRMCDISDGVPACSGGQTCQPVVEIEPNLGICL